MLNYPHSFHINPTSILVCMKVKVAQLCPTLCDPMDYTVHGILQARILGWVAFPFSRGSSQPRDEPRSPAAHVSPPLLSPSPTTVGHLLQLADRHWYSVSPTVHGLP